MLTMISTRQSESDCTHKNTPHQYGILVLSSDRSAAMISSFVAPVLDVLVVVVVVGVVDRDGILSM
jgi:hypothetical protein